MIVRNRNWYARPAEVKKLRPDLLICVDHEGGRVQRFRTDGFTALPAMRVLGEQWMRDPLGATDAASALGFVLGAELRACGVDLSFTPVLDLDYGGSSVIGDRAFHRDARVAALLAKGVMHGLLRAGMGNCGKHFPGHGYVKADSHVAVPVDKRSLKAILADDAKPYEWLSTTLCAVMPAHVIYPKVDSHPAGLSPRWLNEILRGEMGFTGAIFSDDLSMEGARHLGPRRAAPKGPNPLGGRAPRSGDQGANEGGMLTYAEAATVALNAGCDLVLLCNQSVDGGQAVDELLVDLQQAQAQAYWAASADSEQRRLALLPTLPPLVWDDLMHDPVYQRALERLP